MSGQIVDLAQAKAAAQPQPSIGVRSVDELPELGQLSHSELPYETLAELRRNAPFVRGPLGIVIALRREHAEFLTSSVTRQVEIEPRLLQGITEGPIFEFTANAMLMANGEAHQRRRKPMVRAFSFKLMDAIRPKAAELAEALIRPHLGAGPIDFLQEVATQVPARMIAEVLGIPAADLPLFLQWISSTAEAIGFIDLARRAEIEADLHAFNDYVTALIEDRRRHPREDFLTEYVRATAEGGDMSEAEIRAQLVNVILGGSDTTRGSLCMVLSQILRHPKQWADFCADPEGLAKAVLDEGMRLEPVVSLIPRVALQDIELDGWLIPAGRMVCVSLLSSMRDPAVFERPDEFDIHRRTRPKWPLVFGVGAHRCLGEALARAEMEETLKAIARLAPNTELIGAPPKLKPGSLRLVDQMRVAFA